MATGWNRLGGGGAARSADPRLAAAIDDFFLPDAERLDERTRLLLGRVLGGLVGAIDADLRRHAARLVGARGGDGEAAALLAVDGDVLARLTGAGLLRDEELMEELIGRVRTDLLAEALPVAVGGPERPSLLVRLAESGDGVVASAARALLAAEGRRRDANETGAIAAGDLAADLHERLVWWVVAAIRERLPATAAIDRALAEAAARSLAAHDDSDQVEIAAARLAAAIDPLPGEMPALLVETIGDRRLLLFVALLARTLDLDLSVARALALEPEGDRLWPALRAAGVGRHDLARIALALCDADPRRDIERFADRLDVLAAIDPAAAREALAPLSLPRAFRLAMRALAVGPPR